MKKKKKKNIQNHDYSKSPVNKSNEMNNNNNNNKKPSMFQLMKQFKKQQDEEFKKQKEEFRKQSERQAKQFEKQKREIMNQQKVQIEMQKQEFVKKNKNLQIKIKKLQQNTSFQNKIPSVRHHFYLMCLNKDRRRILKSHKMQRNKIEKKTFIFYTNLMKDLNTKIRNEYEECKNQNAIKWNPQ